MSSSERLNLSEQDNGHPTGWEEVAAMADKMPAKESANNLTDEDDADADGMIDTSGRKYQAIFERAESINSENTRAYNIDRRSKNYQMLLEKDKDLADLYKDILTEFPDLDNVELINFDTRRETKNGKPNAFFSPLAMENGQYRPIVKFNFNEPEVYFDGTEGGGDALALAQSVKEIAMKVGVDANEALKNKKFMTSFLLLHELGHALDFKRNYLDANNGDLKEAFILNRESRRRDEMTMPVPGAIEAYDTTKEDMENLHKRFDSRFSGMGIHNGKQLKLVESRKYREMHCERMADGFARNYVLRHYNDFFTPTENSGDGRLSTKFEKSIEMGEDFSEVLGLEEGTRVRFTLLSRPNNVMGRAKVGDMIDGYLSKTAMLGEPLQLQRTNDPMNPGRTISVSGGIKKVSIIPHAIVRKDAKGNEQRGVNNEVRFIDADGRVYRIEKARDQAKKIEGDNTEMLKALNESLGLKAGSEVQLLKREVAGRGASPIQEGELKMGKLTTNGISLDGVEMITDDGRRLKTSFVDSIYREWKTFYIDTATSTYEVIPVRS
ncbi:hypothetical protein IKG24_01675 [Candidatus Saccharibacteria bacterium]|nr:hypothetical protein [Candidatus Saccharibacteria bacterium]